jgi:hypothetical protein
VGELREIDRERERERMRDHIFIEGGHSREDFKTKN